MGLGSINDTPKQAESVSNGSVTGADVATHDEAGLAGWHIALILAGVLILCAAAGAAAFIAYRRARRERKVHGEYRPQQEEQLHAKHLPYITPPNIEGLI